MRSRGERIVWSTLAAIAVAGSAAAWWTADQWLPHAGPWAQQAWRKVTRPGPETLPQGKAGRPAPAARGTAPAPPPPPRKCVDAQGRTIYTDQLCPKGAREYGMDGATTVLPQ